MKGSGKLWLRGIILMLLIFSVSGCSWLKTKKVVLTDSEDVKTHPSDPNKVCMDRGYLVEIFEQLNTCCKSGGK